MQDTVYNLSTRQDVKTLSTQSVKRQKTAQVNLRISPDLKEAAERAAKADNRSLTSLVEKLLSDYAAEKGFLAP